MSALSKPSQHVTLHLLLFFSQLWVHVLVYCILTHGMRYKRWRAPEFSIKTVIYRSPSSQSLNGIFYLACRVLAHRLKRLSRLKLITIVVMSEPLELPRPKSSHCTLKVDATILVRTFWRRQCTSASKQLLLRSKFILGVFVIQTLILGWRISRLAICTHRDIRSVAHMDRLDLIWTVLSADQNQSLLLVLYPVDVFMIRFYLTDEFIYPG